MKIYSFGMIEYWYDRSTKCWWCREIDAYGNQVGDADHAYTKDEILARVTEWANEVRNRPETSAEIGERNRKLMFGENYEAFPSDEEWSRIVD